MRNTILVVDDTEENIDVLVDLLSEDYKLLVALNGKRALELALANKPDLILLDIMMPEMNGYDVCKALKSDESTIHIPIVFITALRDDSNEELGISLGAVDYIVKPFNPALVKARVKNHLKLKSYQDNLEKLVMLRTAQIERTQLVIIKSMGVLAEYRDPETGEHIKRTQNYVKILANCLKNIDKFRSYFTEEIILSLFKSAPLHDVGKVGVQDSILLKPGKLTEDEFKEMKKHPEFGRNAIQAIQDELPNETFLKHAIEIAFTHHEKWDGSGYPRGLIGEEIPIAGRLMAIADVYDALVSKRVYKEAFSHKKAVGIIKEGRGAHFDPDMIDAFMKVEDIFEKTAKKYIDKTI